MKLRNKKTGEIRIVHINWFDGRPDRYFDSLSEAKEELSNWEDAIPKEPLIKNVNIRNIVRNWAKQNNYEHIYYDRAYNRLADDYDFIHCIEFIIDPLPDAESERSYTITELCGEDEA